MQPYCLPVCRHFTFRFHIIISVGIFRYSGNPGPSSFNTPVSRCCRKLVKHKTCKRRHDAKQLTSAASCISLYIFIYSMSALSLALSHSVAHFCWLEKSVCQHPTMITATTMAASRVGRAGGLSATLHIFTLPVWFHIANKMADRRVSAMAPWHLPACLPATQWIDRATYWLYTHIDIDVFV